MPTYDFECLTEKDGCGEKKVIRCDLATHKELQKDPPKCGKCGNPMNQVLGHFGQPGWATSLGIQN